VGCYNCIANRKSLISYHLLLPKVHYAEQQHEQSLSF
jgi:hypothetical protein